MPLKYIELFAGCGGLSLGLESAGYELEMACELSPMAAETFAYNLLGEDITNGTIVGKAHKHCYVGDLKDIGPQDWQDKKLVIGDVTKLVKHLSDRPELVSRFKGVDLISGGPPCQGFSMAGRREERDPKNRLPYAFVDMVGLIRPNFVLLENVEGITKPFKRHSSIKKPWLEIAKAFAAMGYAPLCFMLNAKYFGVPQNRPRFILVGIRKEYEKPILNKLYSRGNIIPTSFYWNAFRLANLKPYEIFEFDGSAPGLEYHFLDFDKLLYKAKKDLFFDNIPDLFQLENLLPQFSKEHFSVKEAIDDLSQKGGIRQNFKEHIEGWPRGTDLSKKYSEYFARYIKHPIGHLDGLYNHELRTHSEKVSFRFALMQEAQNFDPELRIFLFDFLRKKKKLDIEIIGGEWKYIWTLDPIIQQNRTLVSRIHKELMKNEGFRKKFRIRRLKNDFISKLVEVKTSKHSQRPLEKDKPAPSQVTIPDDLCHYDPSQNRVLSVREMARIQSFPDNFVFRSKVTTGGGLRHKDVPQYTQVGNAVPPVFGRNLGQFLLKLSSIVEKEDYAEARR